MNEQERLIEEFEAHLVERYRKALMEAHHHDWSMETISEAAHICAHAQAHAFFAEA